MNQTTAASRRTVLRTGLRVALAGAAGVVGARRAHADTLAEIRRRGELVCATEMEFPPFDFLDNTEYRGVDRDLIDEIGKDLGVRVTYLDLPWTEVLPGLEAMKFDFVIAPVIVTAERMRRYSFTVPIAEATVALMRRSDDASIARPDGIAGKTVGGQKHSSAVAQLAKWSSSLPKPVTIKEYVDISQCYDDLAVGRLDAAVNTLPNLDYCTTQHPSVFAVVRPPFGRTAYYSWVGRKGPVDQSLTDAISAALLAIQQDGRMATIQRKWFGRPSVLPRTVPVPVT